MEWMTRMNAATAYLREVIDAALRYGYDSPTAFFQRSIQGDSVMKYHHEKVTLVPWGQI